ncbi:uncharacterized protein IWZ02DRAFT_301677 [Phyllosticta citriasiana]|uniref:uncharacterized protein n=1 Tax=Phyllosticta citriasiana TaxID=595635 RepID=UPI0030FDDFB4
MRYTRAAVAILVHSRSRTSAARLYSCQWHPPSLSTRAPPSTIETYHRPHGQRCRYGRASKLCCPSPVCRAAWMPFTTPPSPCNLAYMTNSSPIEAIETTELTQGPSRDIGALFRASTKSA